MDIDYTSRTTRNITLGLLGCGAALWIYACDRPSQTGSTTQTNGTGYGHAFFFGGTRGWFGGGGGGEVGGGTVRGGFGHSFGGIGE